MAMQPSANAEWDAVCAVDEDDKRRAVLRAQLLTRLLVPLGHKASSAADPLHCDYEARLNESLTQAIIAATRTDGRRTSAPSCSRRFGLDESAAIPAKSAPRDTGPRLRLAPWRTAESAVPTPAREQPPCDTHAHISGELDRSSECCRICLQVGSHSPWLWMHSA